MCVFYFLLTIESTKAIDKVEAERKKKVTDCFFWLCVVCVLLVRVDSSLCPLSFFFARVCLAL